MEIENVEVEPKIENESATELIEEPKDIINLDDVTVKIEPDDVISNTISIVEQSGDYQKVIVCDVHAEAEQTQQPAHIEVTPQIQNVTPIVQNLTPNVQNINTKQTAQFPTEPTKPTIPNFNTEDFDLITVEKKTDRNYKLRSRKPPKRLRHLPSDIIIPARGKRSRRHHEDEESKQPIVNYNIVPFIIKVDKNGLSEMNTKVSKAIPTFSETDFQEIIAPKTSRAKKVVPRRKIVAKKPVIVRSRKGANEKFANDNLLRKALISSPDATNPGTLFELFQNLAKGNFFTNLPQENLFRMRSKQSVQKRKVVTRKASRMSTIKRRIPISRIRSVATSTRRAR